MGSIWHYNRGTWTEGPSWPEGDWDQFIKESGYVAHAEISDRGSGAGTSAALYDGGPDTAPYLILLSFLERCEMVTAGTLPDALELLAKYAPMVMAIALTDVIADFRDDDAARPYSLLAHTLASVQAYEPETAYRARQIREANDRQDQKAAARRASRAG